MDCKNILVTGGAGFVGSHLCERLLDDGHHVMALDDLSTSSDENIRHLRNRPFVFRYGDVTDRMDFGLIFDEVYHLACPASPPKYQQDPVKTIETCVVGTRNALDLARGSKAKLLLASTSEVYGDPEVGPQDEDYRGNVNPVGPRACYDEGKRCAEALTSSYAAQHKVDVRIARIFNTYGPRLSEGDGRVVSNFVVQALRGEPLTVCGDGRQTRSFCYVSDLVDGLVRLMEVPDLPVMPVNLGNPEERTMLDLAERVLALTGSRSHVVHVPLPIDDPRRRRPSIERAKALLGWEPSVGLDDGLRKTVDYFAERLAKPPPKARCAP